ncbi:hypothetical protein [Propionivibrio sp.]|uniref:hypothetical protein n=1 Tax=Propionivibrio sp. TaxID=2212460 RepID=UPI003BF376E5
MKTSIRFEKFLATEAGATSGGFIVGLGSSRNHDAPQKHVSKNYEKDKKVEQKSGRRRRRKPRFEIKKHEENTEQNHQINGEE